WVIIPRPHENVCAVLPIDYTEEVMPYFDRVEGRTLPIAPNN
ncbi:MAG: carbon dioxide-concentrating protein CcmK, partial [Cyanobacteria bacterium P01_A01_bin.83]